MRGLKIEQPTAEGRVRIELSPLIAAEAVQAQLHTNPIPAGRGCTQQR